MPPASSPDPDQVIDQVAQADDRRRRLRAAALGGTLIASLAVACEVSLWAIGVSVCVGAWVGASVPRRLTRTEAADRLDEHLNLPQTLGTYTRTEPERQAWLASAARASLATSTFSLPPAQLRPWPLLASMMLLLVAVLAGHGGGIRDLVAALASSSESAPARAEFTQAAVPPASPIASSAEGLAAAKGVERPMQRSRDDGTRSPSTSGSGAENGENLSYASSNSAVGERQVVPPSPQHLGETAVATSGDASNPGQSGISHERVERAASVARPAVTPRRAAVPRSAKAGEDVAEQTSLPHRYRSIALHYFASTKSG